MLQNWLKTDNRFLLWAAGFLVLGAFLQSWHLSERRELDMPISAQEGSGDLVKAGIYSLGSVRGLVATALWMEVIDAKNKRDYVRLKGNCDLLMEVQPKFTSTAKFLAYTEILDLTDQMPGLDEKYYWVRSGLNILDAGFRRNPRSAALPQELAWLYDFRFSERRSDGAALAEKDARSPREHDAVDDPADRWYSDRHRLCSFDRAPGDTEPRYSIATFMPDGRTPLRQPRCIECFYWALYYADLAAQRNDANNQSIYTSIQDCHKKIAWFSEWPIARRHLRWARDTVAVMDQDAVRRNLPQSDAYRRNFAGEMFYLLLEALPRRARSPAEKAEIAREADEQWAWYQSYFAPPLYPAEPIFHSPREAADWHAAEMTPLVADWNNYHPDEPKSFHEQLPR